MLDHHLLVGRLADEAIKGMNFDLLFLGLEGIDADAGLTTAISEAARIKRLMIKNSRRVAVVADRSKFGSSSIIQFADHADIDSVITDQPVSTDIEERLIKTNVEFIDDFP